MVGRTHELFLGKSQPGEAKFPKAVAKITDDPDELPGADRGGIWVSSVVEVAVDPGTAFSVFTEELDLWWVRGPINHHAGGRALAMRCEPGVGGRLLELATVHS